MKSRLLGLGLIVGATLAAVPALAQTKWNLPAAYPSDNPHTENLVAFAKDIDTENAAKNDRHYQKPKDKPKEAKDNTVPSRVERTRGFFELGKLRQIAAIDQNLRNNTQRHPTS